MSSESGWSGSRLSPSPARGQAEECLLYNQISIAGPLESAAVFAAAAAPLTTHKRMLSALFRALGILAVCAVAMAGAARADEAGEIQRLFAAGHTDDAFTRLDKLLAEKPRDPQLRFLKGVLLADSKRPAQAAELFAQLTVDYPEIPEPYNNLAVIHAERGEFDKARALLEAALRAQPAYAVAHQNLGDIYTQLARLSYQQALKLDPGNSGIPPKLALLRDIVNPVAAPAAPRTP